MLVTEPRIPQRQIHDVPEVVEEVRLQEGAASVDHVARGVAVHWHWQDWHVIRGEMPVVGQVDISPREWCDAEPGHYLDLIFPDNGARNSF